MMRTRPKCKRRAKRVALGLMMSFVLVVGLPSARAIESDHASAVPADAMATIWVDRDSQADAASAQARTGSIAKWASLLLSSGGLPGIFPDVVASLDVLRPFPWAVALLDVDVEALADGGYRFDGLQLGLVVHTRGGHAPITHRIQDMLERWTTRETASIDHRDVNDARVFTLIDSRTPNWCKIEWGAVGEWYVVTLGEGAFERFSSTLQGKQTSITEVDEAKQLLRVAESDRAPVVWRVHFDKVRSALAPMLTGPRSRVIAELGFAGKEDVCWSARREGRAVVIQQAKRTRAGVRARPISRAVIPGEPASLALPDGATTYGCIPYEPAEVIERAVSGYVTSRNPKVQANTRRVFEEFEAKRGETVRAGLLDQFGDVILIHDYPEHPAHIPIARTVMFEITGSPDSVRHTLDDIFTEYGKWMGGQADDRHDLSDMFKPRLERLEDGIWTLRMGLYGPAVGVDEHWVVISYAPIAVRQNLEYLAKHADAVKANAKEAATPAPSPDATPNPTPDARETQRP